MKQILNKLTKTLFILLFSLSFLNLTLAAEIPQYPGNGVYFEFGNPSMLSTQGQKNVEEKLLEYQANTDWEIGVIILKDYKNYNYNWETVLTEIRNKNYTPNGLLLLVDQSNRKTHLFVDPALESADKWRLSYSNYVLDTLLTTHFRKGNYEEGLIHFIEYADRETGNYTSLQRFGFFFTMFLFPFLFLTPIGWGITAFITYFSYVIIKKQWYIYKIRRVYENNTKLYQADFQGLENIIKNKELLTSGIERIGAFREEVEQFFEQRNKTYKESKNLYKKAEQLENEFVEFVGNAEKWDQEISNKKIHIKDIERKINKKVSEIDL